MPTRSSRSNSTDEAQALGENKAIKFQITTGGTKYQAVLTDRATYERIKSQRKNSSDTVKSDSSSGSS